jgi:cytoskeletal protein CcmA (bactofilin family)
VHGRVEAGQRIEIFAPAQVIGDISAPTVTIDSGVVFNGNCQIQAVSKPPEPKVVKEPEGTRIPPEEKQPVKG